MRLILDGIHGSGEIHFEVLNAICGSRNRGSALDVMCCEGNSTAKLQFDRKVFVDIQYRQVNRKYRDMVVITDVFNFLQYDGTIYDVGLCMDGIEHLTKNKGMKLINMLQLAAEKVIFFTPLGDYCLTEDDDPDHHHSGWYPADFEELGYATIVFPKYHEEYNVGAFFAFRCDDTLDEFARIEDEINQLSWTKK